MHAMRGESSPPTHPATNTTEIPTEPWARTVQEVLEDLGTSSEQGLPGQEARQRQRRFGPNPLWQNVRVSRTFK